MNRAEAISLIENEIQCVLTQRNCKRDCEHCPLIKPEGDIREAFDMAIEALKFRGAYEIAVKAANKAFENRWKQWVEWIPCSDEKLPQEYENVLVTDENGEVLMAYYIQDMSEDMSIDWYDVQGWVIKPTAWMSLPTPYSDPTPSEEGGNK